MTDPTAARLVFEIMRSNRDDEAFCKFREFMDRCLFAPRLAAAPASEPPVCSKCGCAPTAYFGSDDACSCEPPTHCECAPCPDPEKCSCRGCTARRKQGEPPAQPLPEACAGFRCARKQSPWQHGWGQVCVENNHPCECGLPFSAHAAPQEAVAVPPAKLPASALAPTPRQQQALDDIRRWEQPAKPAAVPPMPKGWSLVQVEHGQALKEQEVGGYWFHVTDYRTLHALATQQAATIAEQAAQLDALRAENAEVKGQRDRWYKAAGQRQDDLNTAVDTIDLMRAENARLTKWYDTAQESHAVTRERLERAEAALALAQRQEPVLWAFKFNGCDKPDAGNVFARREVAEHSARCCGKNGPKVVELYARPVPSRPFDSAAALECESESEEAKKEEGK